MSVNWSNKQLSEVTLSEYRRWRDAKEVSGDGTGETSPPITSESSDLLLRDKSQLIDLLHRVRCRRCLQPIHVETIKDVQACVKIEYVCAYCRKRDVWRSSNLDENQYTASRKFASSFLLRGVDEQQLREAMIGAGMMPPSKTTTLTWSMQFFGVASELTKKSMKRWLDTAVMSTIKEKIPEGFKDLPDELLILIWSFRASEVGLHVSVDARWDSRRGAFTCNVTVICRVTGQIIQCIFLHRAHSGDDGMSNFVGSAQNMEGEGVRRAIENLIAEDKYHPLKITWSTFCHDKDATTRTPRLADIQSECGRADRPESHGRGLSTSGPESQHRSRCGGKAGCDEGDQEGGRQSHSSEEHSGGLSVPSRR